MVEKHTPGPWDAGSREIDICGSEFIPIDTATRSVAFVPAALAADARLIAAAPDLLDAGAALIADVRRRYPGEELRCEYMRVLEAAIAKAVTP